MFLTLFAVKTFERALPDEIYVPFGEKAVTGLAFR